jgi:hypothetical protein
LSNFLLSNINLQVSDRLPSLFTHCSINSDSLIVSAYQLLWGSSSVFICRASSTEESRQAS